MGLVAWCLSGTYNFEVAPRFLVDMWTLSSPYIIGSNMQKIVCLIAGPVLIDGFNAFRFRKPFEIEKYLICCHRSVMF
jgi:hypothetical protein